MRYLLALFFLMMYAGDKLGLNFSLGPGLSSKNMLIYLTFCGIAVNAAIARNRSIDLPEVLTAFAMLILYSLLTWLFAAFVFQVPDYDALPILIVLKSSLVDQFLTFLVFFFGLIHAKDARSLLRVIVWITVLGNIVTLIDTFDVPNLGILENSGRVAGRFDGFIGQPNLYGQLIVLFMGATIALWATEAKTGRRLAAIGAIAALIALVMTGSRGSYTGMLVGSLFAAFFLRKFIPATAVVRAGVAVVLMLALVVLLTIATGYSDVYLTSFGKFEGGAHMATSGRSNIWMNSIRAMLESPWSFITGFGFDAYESTRTFYRASHNTYLTYFYNLGAIGLVLYVFIFMRILVVARSAMENAPADYRPHLMGLVFGLSAFLIAIFFSEYRTAGYLLWAYLGIGMRIAVEARKGSLAKSESDLRPASAIRRQAWTSDGKVPS